MLFSLISMPACIGIANRDKVKAGCPSMNEESDSSQSRNMSDECSNHFSFHEEK